MKPVAWVKYSVGKLPHFVPVIGESAMFECSAIEALEYEPLYTADQLLARQVPPDCVVVLREPTEAMKKAAEAYRDKCLVTPGMQKTFGGYYRAMIAAGEVK